MFVESHITNGIFESINRKIQLAKRQARGYRNINMIYFLCGKVWVICHSISHGSKNIYHGESATHCKECAESMREVRRKVIPCKYCLAWQSTLER